MNKAQCFTVSVKWAVRLVHGSDVRFDHQSEVVVKCLYTLSGVSLKEAYVQGAGNDVQLLSSAA